MKNPETFSFIVSSCATLMTESPIYDTIDKLKPDFFVNIGDMHYSG